MVVVPNIGDCHHLPVFHGEMANSTFLQTEMDNTMIDQIKDRISYLNDEIESLKESYENENPRSPEGQRVGAKVQALVNERGFLKDLIEDKE